MSLIDKAIRAAGAPKSLWVSLAMGALTPLMGLAYFLLEDHEFIPPLTVAGFFFFLAFALATVGIWIYAFSGMLFGRYPDLRGRSWSTLPW